MSNTRLFVRNKILVVLVAFLILFGGAATFVATLPSGDNAYASAEIVGNEDTANVRALVTSNGTDRVRRIVYFKMESHATGGANTPVASGQVCDLAGMLHFAEVKFEGTLAGSAPTLAIKWQNSKDGGATWTDVGTWVTINATVTPATQQQVVSDILGATAVVYGDCWRATYTMGAGGSGTFSITGLEK